MASFENLMTAVDLMHIPNIPTISEDPGASQSPSYLGPVWVTQIRNIPSIVSHEKAGQSSEDRNARWRAGVGWAHAQATW